MSGRGCGTGNRRGRGRPRRYAHVLQVWNEGPQIHPVDPEPEMECTVALQSGDKIDSYHGTMPPTPPLPATLTIDPTLGRVLETITLLPVSGQRAPLTSGSGLSRWDQFLAQRPPQFEDISDPIVAEKWMDDVQHIFRVLELNDHEKVRFAAYMLRGDAERWWVGSEATLMEELRVSNTMRTEGLSMPQWVTWEMFVQAFSDQYFPRTYQREMRHQFDYRVQEPTAKESVMGGLGYKELVDRAMIAEMDIVKEREESATFEDSRKRRRDESFDGRHGSDSRLFSQQQSYTRAPFGGMQVAPIGEQSCAQQFSLGQSMGLVTSTNQSSGSVGKRRKKLQRKKLQRCFLRRQEGHISVNCSVERICFQCYQSGHYARDCPTKGGGSWTIDLGGNKLGGTSEYDRGGSSSSLKRGTTTTLGNGITSGSHGGRGARPQKHNPGRGQDFALTEQEVQESGEAVFGTVGESVFRNLRVDGETVMANLNRSTFSDSLETKGTHMVDLNMDMHQTPINQQNQNSSDGPVAILWDIENCPVPSDVRPEDVGGNIRMALQVHPVIKGTVKMFSAYGDFSAFPRRLREGCQRTGVKLIDVPNGRKDAADKAILVDMFLFALDNHPPSSIVLISGDVDFAPALHILGQRGYTVILVIPSGVGISSALCNAGKFVWDWPSIARGQGFVLSTKTLIPGRGGPADFAGKILHNTDTQNEE